MSKIQSLIEDAIRADQNRRGFFGQTIQNPDAGRNYGYLKAPCQLVGELRLCSRMFNRSVVLCGGCNNGKVPKRDEKGRKVQSWANWPEHVDCGGTGMRTNKRYGRPVKSHITGTH